MGRAAQEQLTELENQGAPFIDQLEQAALFVGTNLEDLSLVPSYKIQPLPGPRGGFHGREEWVLKWLLKKLQSADGDGRKSVHAWRLLIRLLERVPLRNAARALQDRKFIVLLRQALEEAVHRKTHCESEKVDSDLDSSETAQVSPVKLKGKLSRKRKRSGEVTSEVDSANGSLNDLLNAIFSAVELIVSLTKERPTTNEDVGESVFAQEYMKSVIRTTSEEAAKVVGAWLLLCQGLETPALSPVYEIWALRISKGEDASHSMFATYCLESSLALLSSPLQCKTGLERLVARNIIMPAKRSRTVSSSTSLATLAVPAVSRNPSFAPIIFDIAIRCLPPKTSGRYGQEDSSWLEEVFSTLNDSISVEDWSTRNKAIHQMLRIANKNNVVLELPLVRSLAASSGFPAVDQMDVDIISILIEMDANVFLIIEPEEDLLKKLLDFLTLASVRHQWPSVADKIVDEILVPLMGKFATARNLAGFLHHWFEQLTKFEDIRNKMSETIVHFSAWEDDALQAKLREVMEDSLNIRQMLEIVEWLTSLSNKYISAVTVLTEAVVGAITRYETAETLATKLCSLVSKLFSPIKVNEDLPDRYKARRFRLALRIIEWQSVGTFQKFLITDDMGKVEHASAAFEKDSSSFEALEAFRCTCAMIDIWSRNEVENNKVTVALSHMLSQVLLQLDSFIQNFKSGTDMGNNVWGQRIKSIEPGFAFLAPAFAEVLLVQQRTTLIYLLASTAKETAIVDRYLERIFWIASSCPSDVPNSSSITRLEKNSDVFPRLWRAMLQNEDVLNNKQFMGHIINMMLSCGTHANNPLERSSACNGFAVRSLQLLPIEVFSKGHRETILKAWKPDSDGSTLDDSLNLAYQMLPLDPAVLSLKLKMMSRSMLYDGIKFQDIVDLAEAITSSRDPKVSLAIFGEIARKTLNHVSETLSQPKSDHYFNDCVKTLQSWIHRNRKSKSNLSCGVICLAQVFVSIFRHKLANDNFEVLCSSFQDALLSNLRRLLQKPSKLRDDESDRSLSLQCTFKALATLEIPREKLADLKSITSSSALELGKINAGHAQQLLDFMIIHGPIDDASDSLLGGDIASSAGRQAIHEKAVSITSSLGNMDKLHLLASLLDDGDANEQKLDKLLAVRHIIVSCEDIREDATSDNDIKAITLSSIYSKLANKLCHAQGVRQFCLLSEAMNLILVTKSRSITQYNIEQTLSAISTICSPSGPALRPTRASTIYHHVATLLTSVLTSHRLKLQRRSHLLVPTLTALLTLLFTPFSSFPASTSRFPPWHNTTPLPVTSAASYARLLTLLSDPSASAVRSHAHQLSSGPALAKREAAEYLPQVLAAYVKLRLDLGLAMDSTVRETLRPGWEAVLEAMTVDGRRTLGEEMDREGRALLAMMVKDWTRFSKWKGD